MHMIFSSNELINHWDNSLVDLLTFPQEQLCFHLTSVFVLMQKSWWIRTPNTAKNHFSSKSCEFRSSQNTSECFKNSSAISTRANPPLLEQAPCSSEKKWHPHLFQPSFTCSTHLYIFQGEVSLRGKTRAGISQAFGMMNPLSATSCRVALSRDERVEAGERRPLGSLGGLWLLMAPL